MAQEHLKELALYWTLKQHVLNLWTWTHFIDRFV